MIKIYEKIFIISTFLLVFIVIAQEERSIVFRWQRQMT